AARIDRLAPDEKALLQQLSVIGREFPLGLIRQVLTQPEAELYRILASLQRKEFLYEQPAFPEVEYLFKHALTQEVAYGTVLQEQRKLLHERTGQALEALYASTLHEHYSDLAHHYQRSPNTEKAIEYLQLAGQQAVQRSANEEAVRHLTAALDLLHTLPDTSERARQELALQIGLGTPLLVLKGWASPALETVFVRARELSQRVGDSALLFRALVWLRLVYSTRADYQSERKLGEQCLRLAQQEEDPEFLMETHVQSGYRAVFVGDLHEAIQHTEHAISLYNRQRHYSHRFLYGTDPGVASRVYRAVALWVLGYPDQAAKALSDARALAHEIAHPFSLGFALNDSAWFHQFRQEVEASLEWAEATIKFATDQGLPVWVPLGTMFRGWALVMLEQYGEEGITQIRHGLAECAVSGLIVLRSQHLLMLAQAYGKLGQIEAGLTVLAEALTHVNAKGEHLYEAELYRIKGTLTLESQVESHKSKVEEAEACFLKAINIAQKQQAKSLELRATVSLARLWQQQGKRDEAQQMLVAIYGWFTEGFDTKDLQEAKALLDELRQQ
ncbi:MAG: hypothetical protein HY267_02980, partial [Deltaproteobacteria bacterium]|nr:hypothetical protein [Deltaproteobacteria bacterium]